MAASTIRVAVPRNTEQATATAELVARLDGQIAATNAQRDASIAQISAAADAVLAPIVEERDACAVALKTWFERLGHRLLTGKRKTLELGGCMIGTKSAATSLAFTDGAFDKAVELLKPLRWAKGLLRVKIEVDKKIAKAALDGARGDELRRLGFSVAGGGEVFVLETVTQVGTVQAKG